MAEVTEFLSRARLSVRFDPRQIAEVQRELAEIADGMPRAMAGAINKVVPKTRTRLIRSVTEILNLRANTVRDRTRIRKASPASLTGYIDITKKKVSLADFHATQNKRGVKVRIYKDRNAEQLDHYFINRGRQSGEEMVLSRKSSGSGLVPRYPIRKRYGQSVYGLLQQRQRVIKDELEVTKEELAIQLNSQVDRLLQRRRIEE
jgi:hypothetical protein